MSSLSDKDRINLMAILSASKKIMIYTDGIKNYEEFYEDERTFDSVLMNFVVIGESVAKLSEEFKKAQPEIPWNKIKSFRNFIAHDYFGIDSEEVWQLIQSHLPKLELDIRKITE